MLCQRPSIYTIESLIPAIVTVVVVPYMETANWCLRISAHLVLWHELLLVIGTLLLSMKQATWVVTSHLDVCQDGCYGAELSA